MGHTGALPLFLNSERATGLPPRRRGEGAAPAGITHGRQINATNSGIAGAGLTPGDLTSGGAGVTLSTNGQTITGKSFTGGLTVSGSNVTLVNCQISTPAGIDNMGVYVTGTGFTAQYCDVFPASGGGLTGWNLTVAGATLTRCTSTGFENLATVWDANARITECYFHDVSTYNAAGHYDTIEVYGGSVGGYCVIERCRLIHGSAEQAAVINCAPYGTSSVNALQVVDCYIDGASEHILVDNQGTGTITNTQVLRNDMGGHTTVSLFGRYMALYDADARGTVETAALLAAAPDKILWPTSGADANYWVDCSDLSPDKTGQVVLP